MADKKITADKTDYGVLARQGVSLFFKQPLKTGDSLSNPLTSSGRKVMTSMQKEYGAEKGKQVFYATINKGKSGTSKWHRGKK